MWQLFMRTPVPTSWARAWYGRPYHQRGGAVDAFAVGRYFGSPRPGKRTGGATARRRGPISLSARPDVSAREQPQTPESRHHARACGRAYLSTGRSNKVQWLGDTQRKFRSAGLRVSEVVALKVSDIDSKRMVIRIEQGKGHKDRYVMLSPHLLELLRAWYNAARPQGWLFPGMNPVNPMTARQLRRACDTAAQMAEIGKQVSPHTLRHSFATHLLEQNTDIRVIQVLLGHAKLDTTSLYTRVATKTIREIMSPLDRITGKLKEGTEPPT